MTAELEAGRLELEPGDTVYLWPVGWERFQHYRDRDPVWVKTYTRLLSDDAYVGLSWAERGLLHGVWLAFARAGGRIPIGAVDKPVDAAVEDEPDTGPTSPLRTSNLPVAILLDASRLTRVVGLKVYKRSIASLYRAGFLEFLASETLDERLQDASIVLAQSKRKSKRDARASGLNSESPARASRGASRNGEPGRLEAGELERARRAALVSFVRGVRAEYPDPAVLLDELTDRGLSLEEAREVVLEADEASS